MTAIKIASSKIERAVGWVEQTPLDIRGTWQAADPRVPLASNLVQLWRLSPTDWADHYDRFWSLLDWQEKTRAERFRFQRDRLRFVVARGSLRCLLGWATDCHPARVSIAANCYGKPHLGDGRQDIQMNTSHSGDFVVHALTQGGPVGVDVERLRPMAELASITSRFAPDEAVELSCLPEGLRESSFFALWTRKEAYVKGLGTGFSKALNSFSMTARCDEAPRLKYDLQDPRAARLWRFVGFSPDAGYVACLAARGSIGAIHFWDFDEVTMAASAHNRP